MDTIKVYKLINENSGKTYRHITLQNIMDKLHIGYLMAQDFISGDMLVKSYRKKCIIERLLHWSVDEDTFPKNKIIQNADGTFRKGVHVSWGYKWSKGKNYRHPKGYRASPETEFKIGQPAPNFIGFGIPRINRYRRDGFMVLTTINKNKRVFNNRYKKFNNTKVRTSYARYVVGLDEIPKNYVVFHKDGDPLNNVPSNLVCISRAELLKVNNGRLNLWV